jgi:hypothetical protein
MGVTVDRLLAPNSATKDERTQRIANRIASAPAHAQGMIEEVIDVMIKGASKRR